MYIGRIVAVARNRKGGLAALYRVSSRSFPNRTAVVTPDKVSIVPKAGHETDVQKNPYIAYNCVRLMCGGQVAVVTNGSQTDPVAEKIGMGVPVRDALASALLTLDYEKDQYDTPRIAAVADRRDDTAWLGIVRRDGLEVRQMPLEAGRFFYVATYEENRVRDAQSGSFAGGNAAAACRFILGEDVFAQRTNPVTAVAAVARDAGFELAALDAREQQ